MAFDVEGARKAGYSDTEIADHLAETAKFDAAAARKSGYSDQELIAHLAADKPPSEPALSNPMGDEGGTGGSSLPPAPSPSSPAPYSALPVFPAPRPGAISRIAEAAHEGAVNTPDASGWAPGGLQLGRYIVNPLMELGGGLLRGGLQFLGEAAGGNPQLTRDIQALPEVFPTGVDMPIEPPSALSARNTVRRATPRTQAQGITDAVTSPFSATRPITVEEITDAIRRSDINAAEVPRNQMMPGETAPPSGPGPGYREHVDPTKPFTYDPPSSGWPAGTESWAEKQAPPPQPPTHTPAPEAVGADVTREPIPPMTPSQTQDAFEKSVLQTAEHRTVPGPNGTVVDETQYVPGALRTDAARIFSPERSVNDRVFKDTDPEGYGKNALKVENDAKDTIFDRYKTLAGDKHAVDAAVQARDAFSPDQLGVFEKQQPTSKGQGIVDYFNRLLNSPEGKRGNVASILKDARDGFLDAKGNPETMPSMLYGGRKNLTDILNEGLGSSTSARKASVQAARKFLTDALENHVDPAINSGAPLFDTFRSQWSALSKPIDRMNFLQEHMFGPGDVRGGDGKIFFQGVQNLLEKMAKLRRGVGNNPAKSFDLPDLDNLVAIRNELAAWHLRDRLQNAAGSPTVQRATAAAKLQSGPLGTAIAKAADLAGMGAAGHYFGEAGMMGYHAVGAPVVQRVIQAPAARRLAQHKAELLNTTPRNQLGP